jgi:DNA gyrase subunit A
LQTSFSINNVALVNGRPEILNLKQMIVHFVDHRHEVVVRRTQYDLRKAQERAHILKGLLIALDHLDQVIAIIRGSQTPEIAREGLMTNFQLDEIQSRAILDMRLQRLTGLERDKIREEYDELMKMIARYIEILGSEDIRMGIIKDELRELIAKFGDARRSNIEFSSAELNIEDMIPDEMMAITITHAGYIKRTNLAEYRAQSRGGVGAKGTTARQEDFVEHIFTASNHDWLLIFTQKGRCFWMRVFELPEGAKTTKGRAIQNLIQIEQDDKLLAYIPVKDLMNQEYVNSNYVILCTKQGLIKKTSLEAYSRPRSNGINAITVRDGDELLQACLTDGDSEVIIAKRKGKAIRFPEAKVRPMGRTAAGVRGVTLESADDEVIGMVCVNPRKSEATILVLSEKGYGKRTDLEDYRITGRGGKGVKTISITEKTGSLVGILSVTDEDGLIIICKSGMTIRMAIDKLRVMGRATQGVRLINLKGADSIAGLAKSPKEEDEEETEFIDGETPVVIGGSEENNTVEEAPTEENEAETTDTDE